MKSIELANEPHANNVILKRGNVEINILDSTDSFVKTTVSHSYLPTLRIYIKHSQFKLQQGRVSE